MQAKKSIASTGAATGCDQNSPAGPLRGLISAACVAGSELLSLMTRASRLKSGPFARIAHSTLDRSGVTRILPKRSITRWHSAGAERRADAWSFRREWLLTFATCDRRLRWMFPYSVQGRGL